ncbi:MAG: hypothetical protein JSR87_12120 [Proteobacteria bacterium]|nr:hypothetical protein [Pseudomonadota bacterium]MBS0572495.1 hypothetical protein [Pseudomonadota bacterium]
MTETVTFDQMKGVVASLLLLWANVERALATSIQTLQQGEGPKRTHGIARLLDVWSALVTQGADEQQLRRQIGQRLVDHLKESLEIRNFVAHGLRGITSGTDEPVGEAHICAEMNGQRRVFTWQELQELFAWMSKVPWLIADLTDAATDREPERGATRLVPWKDFPAMN